MICVPNSRVRLTIPDGFDRMAEHIAVHRYFMGLDLKRDISEEEAITHWYDTVYMPIVKVIRKSKILKDFPARPKAISISGCSIISAIFPKKRQSLQPPEAAAQDIHRMRVDD